MASGRKRNPDLPDKMLVKIFRHLAADGLSYLAPILKAGHRGRKTALSPEILKDANIFHICWDPSWFQTSHNPNGVVQEEGMNRRKFERCIELGNKIAIYNKGLRIVAEERDIQRGISLLTRNVLTYPHATLACGLFYMLEGNEQIAVHFLHNSPLSTKIRESKAYLSGVFNVLCRFKTTVENTYRDSFVYPSSLMIPSPEFAVFCIMDHDFYTNNYREYDMSCTDCGLWWVAQSIFEIL